MNYQYLFCATCGVRRMGHGYRCTVCDSLLRRVEHRAPQSVFDLRPIVRADFPSTPAHRQTTPEPARQPVAA